MLPRTRDIRISTTQRGRFIAGFIPRGFIRLTRPRNARSRLLLPRPRPPCPAAAAADRELMRVAAVEKDKKSARCSPESFPH
jgi:hypothetical protein